MSATIVMYAEPPGIGRRGTLDVVVDGVRAGSVKQGEAARFPVAAGTHAVRITARDRSRSNSVTVDVSAGEDFVITARGTGLRFVPLLPVLAGIAVPGYYVVATVLLMGAVLYAVPGSVFRLRADGVPAPRTAPTAGPAADADADTGTGLWWESDPALAKRFRKAAGS